jgi:beta-glucanase (GH16 family)
MGIERLSHAIRCALTIIVTILVCSSCASARANWLPNRPPARTAGWRLIFNDEFDGVALDAGKWSTCYWWSEDGGCTIASNNEMQWYQPENVLVKNGVLRLMAERRNLDGYRYASGMISSHGKFSFQYGFVEARMKVPAGQGLWPAFWALPEERVSKPEIDLMELLGSRPNEVRMTLHYLDADGEVGRSSSRYRGADFSTGYHIFGLEWRKDALIWYVDGVERKRFTEAAHIPRTPMYVLANLAVGGDWPGSPDKRTPFPSYLNIDYIRVWQR